MNKKKHSIDNFHLPRWNELPNVDLYLDQVVNFINSTLSPYIFLNNDKKKENIQLLTKTMINNYVKNELIEAPVKKQYSKIQLAKLFVICILKQVYSMQDIRTLISIALENTTAAQKYDTFCNLFEECLSCTFEEKEFVDNNSDNSHLLRYVLLSCSYKIYVQSITFGDKKEN
jgi:hypothetical protein